MSFPRLISVFAFVGLTLLGSDAAATLKLYYDPSTGNVSFDTTETRNGEVILYVFDVKPQLTALRFRPESLVRLSGSSLFTAKLTQIQDSTRSTPWRGLYTIGNVFPTGLTEEFWTTSFVTVHGATHFFGYIDILGGGRAPDAEFIYGPPAGVFENRWDLVDPDSLQWATSASLIYMASTGELRIDTTGDDGGYITTFLLESNNQFLPDGFAPFSEGIFNSADQSTVFYAEDAIEPGTYAIGRLLPANLSHDQFVAAIANARFAGRAGYKGAIYNFDLESLSMTLEYVEVPEVPSLVYAAVAGFGIGCFSLLRTRAPGMN